MEPEELADSLKRLTAWAEQHAPAPESAVQRRLQDHLGRDPVDRPIVSRDLAAWDRPNFQVAVDAWSTGRGVEVVGLPVIQGYRAGLAELGRTSGWGPRLELYGEGLELTLTGEEPLIAALEGVSPAFIRELLRRAALLAAEESEGALTVSADHLARALEELQHGAGELTNVSLGAVQLPPREVDEPWYEE